MKKEGVLSMNISVIDRVALILKSFTHEKFELGITELSTITGLSTTTIHRLANAMVAAEFLSYNNANKKFKPNISLLHLGSLVKAKLSLISISKPFMMDLNRTTNETIMLKVIDQDFAVTVEFIESKEYFRPSSGIGRRDPLYAGASSKVLLASLSNDKIINIFNSGMNKLTDNTLDIQKMKNEINEIRKNGYAVSFGERVKDGVGISVPIYDMSNTVIASLTVFGPSNRVTREKVEEYLPLIKDTGRIISNQLGYNLQ